MSDYVAFFQRNIRELCVERERAASSEVAEAFAIVVEDVDVMSGAVG